MKDANHYLQIRYNPVANKENGTPKMERDPTGRYMEYGDVRRAIDAAQHEVMMSVKAQIAAANKERDDALTMLAKIRPGNKSPGAGSPDYADQIKQMADEMASLKETIEEIRAELKSVKQTNHAPADRQSKSALPSRLY